MRRGLVALVVLLGLAWLVGHSGTGQAPQQRQPTATPPATTEQLLTRGRELFDAWQKPDSRKTVTLDAVASVMGGLERVTERDKLYAISRQAIEVLRPIRETLADEEIKRQALETDKRLKEARAQAAAERKRVVEDAPGRKSFASELEHQYLRRGMDVTVTVEGDRNTTLRLRYVLISRPVVYNFINDRDLMANLKSRGFRQLVMTDGYNSTWRQKVD